MDIGFCSLITAFHSDSLQTVLRQLDMLKSKYFINFCLQS